MFRCLRDFAVGSYGQAVNTARELAATPPNICHPGWVASQARKLARTTGLHCRVIGAAEAEKLGMGGLLNVGKGSAQGMLIILEHRPSKPKSDERLVLVGKTITYDTGGYSLKSSSGMKEHEVRHVRRRLSSVPCRPSLH